MTYRFSTQCAIALACLASAETGSAQVVVGAANVTGWGAPIFALDLPSQTAIGPIWTTWAAVGMAADDVGGVLYTSTIDMFSNAGVLWSWSYGSANAPAMLGQITDNASGSLLKLDGMVWANGKLHAIQNNQTTTGVPEGIYEIDLVNMTATGIHLFSDPKVRSHGLGHDTNSGLFYCINRNSSFPGGAGIVEVDPIAQTETFITAFPAGVTNVDGCAVDPAGRVFVVEPGPAPLHTYDLNTGMYDPSPMSVPFGHLYFYAGIAWAPGFFANITIGTDYCGPAVTNSSGQPGSITAFGSAAVTENDVLLVTSQLPTNQFGYFLTSQQQGFVQNPGGSQGNLCLGSPIVRLLPPVLHSGGSGSFSLPLDLGNVPQVGTIHTGETWNFTAWFRDNNPGPTSNFTDAVSVAFQ